MQLDCNSQTVHSTSYRRFSTSVLYLEYFESSAIERDLFFYFQREWAGVVLLSNFDVV